MDTLKSASLSRTSTVSSTPAPQAGPPSVGAFVQQRADQVLGEKKEGGMGVNVMDQPKAETAVAANDARKQNVDFNSLQDPAARKAFVQNVTQLDGSQGGSDGQACGPTSMMMGITMADPKATQRMANGMLEQSTSDRQKMFGKKNLDADDAAALRRVRDGKASPDDVRRMGEMMSHSTGVNTANGASVDEMGKMLGNANELMGGDMPNMEMHYFADAKNKDAGGHWQAMANGVEMDPWPNDKGQATLTDGPGGLAQGASHYENGTVHSKMIVQNGGKDIIVPRYLGLDGPVDGSGKRVSNPDPNQPLTNYHYKQNVFGYGYHRSSGEVPAGVDAGTEPAQEF